MSDFTRNYEIFSVGGFKAQVAKLSKKYNVEISVEYGEPQERQYEDKEGVYDYTIIPVTATFSFGGYKIEGFKYLGCVKDNEGFGLLSIHGHGTLEGKNVIEFINELKSIPCHNCNRKHARKIGHIFQVEETGEIVIFGSACAKNYFGVDFEMILAYFEKIDFRIYEAERSHLGDHFANVFGAKRVAKLAYFFIKSFGFISKAKENDKQDSTSRCVLECLNNPKTFNFQIKYDTDLWNSLEEKDFSEIINFEIDGSTEFGHNIKMVQKKFDQGFVSAYDLGFFCWLVFKVYFYVKPSKIEVILPDVNTGDKLANLKVEFEKVHNYCNQYGVQNIYSFIDKVEKVRYKWFTSVHIDAEIGDSLVIKKAAVKNTEDNDYGKAVIITRAKVEAIA